MEFKGRVPALVKPVVFAPVVGPNGHWDFPEQMGKGVGFVYVIYDRYLNRAYLGKKNFLSKAVKTRGKPSDWKTYKSSSEVLAAHFKERPREEFLFLCIEQYKTASGLSYAETWSQCLAETPTTDAWYNTRIEQVSWNVKERITERHKERLQMVIGWIKGNKCEM